LELGRMSCGIKFEEFVLPGLPTRYLGPNADEPLSPGPR